MDQPQLNGLVLAGGKSRRMGRDKASLRYAGSDIPQWRLTAELLARVCPSVSISVRSGQILEGYKTSDPPLLPDSGDSAGPMSGLLTAMRKCPQKACLVVACDLPLLDIDVLGDLIQNRGESLAVAFQSSHDGLPEPVCAIYEPSMLPVLEKYFAEDVHCPRKILIREASHVKLLPLPRSEALENANTPDDFERLNALAASMK